MKKNLYSFYQGLLFIDLLLILFTKPINYFPNLSFFFIVGFLLILSGAIIDIYWEIFWKKNKVNKKIITNNIYSYIRHPLLLAFILIFFGLAIFFNSFQVLLMAIFSAIIIFIGSKKEEKEIIKEYGREYKEYMKKVPYRFIPKII